MEKNNKMYTIRHVNRYIKNKNAYKNHREHKQINKEE